MPPNASGSVRLAVKLLIAVIVCWVVLHQYNTFQEEITRKPVWPAPNPNAISNPQIPTNPTGNPGTSPSPTEPITWINTTYTDPLSIQRFTRERAPTQGSYHPQPTIMICLMTKDAKSWGNNIISSSRNFASFLKLLHGTKLDFSQLSISVLTSSESEFQTYKNVIAQEPFARVSIFLHPGYDPGIADSSRGNRHKAELQHARRAEVAKLRNYLMLTSLRDEEHVIWFDADIYDISDGIVQAMLAHTTDQKVGVITARSSMGPGWLGDYDKNAWRGARTKPNDEERAKMRDPDGGIGTWTANNAEGCKNIKDLIQDTGDDEIVELDAVGGTLLMIEARLIRQGLTFAPVYLVGLDWESEGWDGIETEGLCVIARGMNAGCYGLGGHWVTHHSLG